MMRYLWAAVGAITLMIGAPGHATAGMEQCPAGWMCMWEHANYGGGFVKFRTNDSTYADSKGVVYFDNTRVRLNDHVSSACNFSGKSVVFCVDSYCPSTSPSLNLYTGYCYPYVGNSFNDKFSAHYFW